MALGVLSGTSGCLRLSSDDVGTTQATGTTATRAGPTTVAGTEESTETTAATLPPYVNEDGPQTELVGHWVQLLGRSSFTLNFTRTHLTSGDIDAWEVRYEDENALKETQDGRDIVLYYGEEAPYWRQSVDDDYTYGEAQDFRVKRAWTRSHELLSPGRVKLWIQTGDWSDVERYDDGSVRITARRARRPTLFERNSGIGTLQSFEGEMLVTSIGIISRIEVTIAFESAHDGTDQRRRTHYSISGYETTTVHDPPWLELAKARAPTVRTEITPDGRAIELEQVDGNPMLPGTKITVDLPEGRGHIGSHHLEEPISAGETWYVWHDTTQLRVTRTPPESSDDTRTFENTYHLHARRAFVEYFGQRTVEA